MKTQNWILSETGKKLNRAIKQDNNGLYISHLNMKAYIEVDRVVRGSLMETTIYKISYYS